MMGNYHARCGVGEKPEVVTPEAYLSLFGQIPNFDKLIATIRSREISASIILQSQSQLKAIYKDATEIISDNCDSVLFLSGRGKNAKEISDALGKETIDSFNTSENRGSQTSHGLNYQKLGKELMSQDEIAVMDGGKCILQLRGVRPFLSEKFDITKHPRYKYLADADKKNTFDVDRFLTATRRKRQQVVTQDEVFDLYEIDLSDEDAEAVRELPELKEGQTFADVAASVTEHFTTSPKPYTEDTLLSAMERAGAEDMPEDAERKGLGTPATRAAILEKLVQMGFVQRKGKQLIPTKDGINLAVVLPEALTSLQLTAEWESCLTEIAKGQADPDEFMAGIEAMTQELVKTYSCISEDKQKLFQTERIAIGTCPRCGEAVYEGRKNYYCGNRACQFVMWKNDRFFEERRKAFTPKIAAALLKDGKAKVKGLYSMKTGKTYDGTVLLADTGGKYVNYRVEHRS